ncbi:unnamed protein product, partial [Sphagnum jensenii]
MLTADCFGFSLNYIRDYIDNKGYTRIEKIDLLPPSTVLFTATARGDIEDIFMYIYTYPYANTQNLFSFPFNYNGLTGTSGGENNGLIGTFGGQNNGIDPWASYGNADFIWRTNILNTFGIVVLDKSKCMHYISDNIIKIANPYGWNPLTRRVYDLVTLYDMYKQLQTSFLSNKACPLLIGYAKRDQIIDEHSGHTMTALDGLYSSMQKMGFMGALLLSGLKDEIYHIEAIPAQGDTKAFENAIDWYAKQIKETMGQVNIQEASYASATTQEGFFSRTLEYKKDRIARTILHTINRYIIERNFSKELKDYGTFEHRNQTLDDRLKTSKLLFEAGQDGSFAP